MVSYLKARIDKLNEYDAYIRKQFNIKIEVIEGDKIIQQGDNSKVEVKN